MKHWVQRNLWWIVLLVMAKGLHSWDQRAIERMPGRGAIRVEDWVLEHCMEYSQRWPSQVDLQFTDCMNQMGGWSVRSE